MEDILSSIFFYYLCNMKEVLFKKEFWSYETTEHHISNEFPYRPTIIKNDFLNFEIEDGLRPTKKHPLFVRKQTHKTEEEFVARFADQMYEVTRSNTIVVVERDGDKVALKLFWGYKYRRPGVVWFKTFKHVEFISVNTKTGDVYVGGIDNYHLKRKSRKRIKRNYFIEEPLNTLGLSIRNCIRRVDNNLDVDCAQEALEVFIQTIDPIDNFGVLTNNQRLFKFYLNKRGVKFPNNFHIYTNEWFGPEIKKILKKTDNRMVDAVMVRNELSGKQIKKALHNCEGLNLAMLTLARNMFNDDWVNQDYELILGCLNSNINYYPLPVDFKEFVTNEELKRVFKLFRHVVIHGTLDAHTFYDHMRFYCDLKLYEPNIKWMSSDDDKSDFRGEHLDWVDKLQSYKEGTYYRKYPDYSYQVISEPIEHGEVLYYPVLLDNSKSYNQESAIQSNCVKTYIGKCGSMIVSLRQGGVDSEVRATIEYKLSYTFVGKIIHVDRVQSLGRFNKKLTEEWDDVLFKLDRRMLYYVKDENFDTVKIKKVHKSGLELESTSYWRDDGRLVWDKEKIENIW
jgi:hypothetical protein